MKEANILPDRSSSPGKSMIFFTQEAADMEVLMARPAFSLTAADPMSSVKAEVRLGPARPPGSGWRGGSGCEELRRQTLGTGRPAVSRKGSPAQRHPSQSQDSSCSA